MQKRRRTAATQFSVWGMVAVGYRSPLVFYCQTEEVDQITKNGKKRTTKQKFGGPMTQKRYIDEVLRPVIRRRQLYCQRNRMDFIFQEDNDGLH